MHPPALPARDHGAARLRLPWATLGTTAALTVAAAAVGQRDWAVPERVLSGWQVAAVPVSLAVLLLAASTICLLVGARVTLRDTALGPRHPAFLVWVCSSLLAAAALVWNALVMAADAEFVVGALIPVFHWLFTFVPALLAGLVARALGVRQPSAVALGTGVVTVPLFALGWSLFTSREPFAAGLSGSLWATAVLGLAPLVVASLVTRRRGRTREQRLP